MKRAFQTKQFRHVHRYDTNIHIISMMMCQYGLYIKPIIFSVPFRMCKHSKTLKKAHCSIYISWVFIYVDKNLDHITKR